MTDKLRATQVNALFRVARMRGEKWTREEIALAWQRFAERMNATWLCYADDDDVHDFMTEYMFRADD